jgi:hypothetical protein
VALRRFSPGGGFVDKRNTPRYQHFPPRVLGFSAQPARALALLVAADVYRFTGGLFVPPP